MKETIIVNESFKGMVAHRGAALINTENTLRAFNFAARKSYLGMECDVHPSKDGLIVISHDSNLKRVSGEDFYIPDHTYEEIKKVKFIDINTGNKDDELYAPLLSEYLELCKEFNKVPVIELKETIKEENLPQIKKLVEEAGLDKKVVFISFFPGSLTKMRELMPEVEIEFLTSVYNDSILDMCVQFNFGIDADYRIMTTDIIDKYHKNTLKVNVYTENDPEDAKKLISYGIDYITSNILE